MAIKGKVAVANGKKVTGSRRKPRSLPIAEKGIQTSKDFAHLMSALIGDIVSERMTPQVSNAVCNAGGKLLKIVEMEYKFGRRKPEQSGRTLALASGGA